MMGQDIYCKTLLLTIIFYFSAFYPLPQVKINSRKSLKYRQTGAIQVVWGCVTRKNDPALLWKNKSQVIIMNFHHFDWEFPSLVMNLYCCHLTGLHPSPNRLHSIWWCTSSFYLASPSCTSKVPETFSTPSSSLLPSWPALIRSFSSCDPDVALRGVWRHLHCPLDLHLFAWLVYLHHTGPSGVTQEAL